MAGSKTKVKRKARTGAGGNPRRAVAIKGHTRSPRGPDAGKKPVRVGPYKRRKPQKKR